MKRNPVLNVAVASMLFASLASPSIATAATAVTAAVTEPVAEAPVVPVAKPAPVLVISSYKTSDERLLVGSAFTLTLDIRNETPRLAENVVVSLSGANGGAAEGATGGSGLAVLGTGNAKYLGQLKGRTTRPVTFKVVAGPGTSPGAMTVPVTVSFEYEGEKHELPYTIGLVFERDAVLAVTLAEFPKEARVGEPFEASFELANTGAFALSGMSLSLEATSAAIEDGSLFVGAFEAAATEGLDVTVTPEDSGPLALVLTAKYRDDFGREKTFTSTYNVQVEADPKPVVNPAEEGDSGEKEKGNWFVRFVRALFGLEP